MDKRTYGRSDYYMTFQFGDKEVQTLGKYLSSAITFGIESSLVSNGIIYLIPGEHFECTSSELSTFIRYYFNVYWIDTYQNAYNGDKY